MKFVPAQIFVLVFAAFAFVQLNDPDKIEWLLIYGVAAALWLNPSSKSLRPIAVILAVACMFWMFDLIPGFRLDLGNEVTREVGGLLLVVIASFARAFR